MRNERCKLFLPCLQKDRRYDAGAIPPYVVIFSTHVFTNNQNQQIYAAEFDDQELFINKKHLSSLYYQENRLSGKES